MPDGRTQPQHGAVARGAWLAASPRRSVQTLAVVIGAAVLAAAGLTGCGSPPAGHLGMGQSSAGGAGWHPKPAALQAQGLPPVPAALAESVQRYSRSAGHALAAWDPQQAHMLVRHRPPDASVTQLWRVSGPGQRLAPLTDGTEPVGQAWVDPADSRITVIQRASGGNEAYQLFRLQPGGEPVQLTDDRERHSAFAWLHQGHELIGASVPLDRTAAAGTRSQITTTLWRMDVRDAGSRRVIAQLPGTGWSVVAVHPDDRELAVLRHRSPAEQWVYRLPLAADPGQAVPRQVLPAAGAPAAAHKVIDYSRDGRALLVLTDAGADRLWPARLDLGTGALSALGAAPEADVEAAELSADGRVLALQLNADAHGTVALRDATTGAPLPVPTLPEGSVQAISAHPQLPLLALTISGAQGPGQIHVLDLQRSSTAAWTQPVLDASLDRSALTGQQVVHWTSFDGLRISGLLSPPAARFTGRRPVLVLIHGGPASQAREGWLGRWHYLLQEMGVAILQPNVRGSTGYGRTFEQLDNGFQREDSVKDIGAALDWIATRPDLDPSRVVVYGGSYGGYMSLAVAATWPDRIAGAIDSVGISHFVTFLERTESYRRDLRRSEYGDERDPAMRAFLHRISPLTNAHRIRQPLLVIQGRNDPRVPVAEAEQIVARVRANGTPVGYLVADNEGHGFARRENADYQFLSIVMFLQRTLGLER